MPGNSTGLHPLAAIAIFAVGVAMIILAGAVPAEYAAAERLELLLPVIHDVLGLKHGDRLTVHRLHSFPSLGYDQITEYYPAPANGKHTVGRRFSISHGIVAQSLSHPGHPIAWAVPKSQEFEAAMMERWFFTEEEMQRITSDRRSFLAYPIGRRGARAAAVLYADSPRCKTFEGDAGKKAIDRIGRLFEGALTNALKG